MGLFSNIINKANNTIKNVDYEHIGESIDRAMESIDKHYSDDEKLEEKLENSQTLGDVISDIDMGEKGNKLKKLAAGISSEQLEEEDYAGMALGVVEKMEFKNKTLNKVVKGAKTANNIKGKIGNIMDIFS